LWNSAQSACVEGCGADEFADTAAEPNVCAACATGCVTCSGGSLALTDCSACDTSAGFFVSADGITCAQCTANEIPIDGQCTAFSESVSRTFGDPHMVGLLGQKFLFDGIAGKIYNVISTPGLQINMQLVKDQTNGVDIAVIGEIGIIVGDDSVYVDQDARLRINNVLASDLTLLTDQQSSVLRDSFHDGKGIVIRTPEFLLSVVPRGYEVDIKEIRMLRKGGNDLHGIVGQTWNAKKWPVSAYREEITDQTVLFSGLIDGSSISDYEVTDGLFGSNFSFNKFDTVAHPLRHAVPETSRSA